MEKKQADRFITLDWREWVKRSTSIPPLSDLKLNIRQNINNLKLSAHTLPNDLNLQTLNEISSIRSRELIARDQRALISYAKNIASLIYII